MSSFRVPQDRAQTLEVTRRRESSFSLRARHRFLFFFILVPLPPASKFLTARFHAIVHLVDVSVDVMLYRCLRIPTAQGW